MAGWSVRRLVIVLWAVLTLAPAAPALAAEPLPGERGRHWVRENPMVVSALVVSMGGPPRWVAAEYLGEFAANAVALWKDGPGEIAGWGDAKSRPRFYTWLDPDGTSVRWNGAKFVSTGEVLGGLGPAFPGRIAFQVGDEPSSIDDLQAIAAGMAAVRAGDPGALVFTNFSYYRANRAQLLDYWVRKMPGDIQMSGDYFFSPLHYAVLGEFRTSAIRKGVPYWQYLNAYVGSESRFVRRHSASDLRWQAFAGLTYGYTGHVWFIYQAAAEGHPTATSWGGSVLFDGVGFWKAPRTPLWSVVSGINRVLAAYGPTMTQLRSTDVRLVAAGDQPLFTEPWTLGAGRNPYLTFVGPAPGQPPMDVLVGFFRDDWGEDYVMVQNARHTHSGRLADPPSPHGDLPGRVRLEFDFRGAPPHVSRKALRYFDAAAGRVGSLAIEPVLPPPPPPPPPGGLPPLPPPPTGKAAVEVLLDPGEVLLFKYDDTFAFRRGPRPEDVGLVDPVTGIWYLRGPQRATSFYYGNPADVPFMGDWDCDGVDTPGLYRPTDGFVYLRNSNTQGIADIEYFFGDPGDVPLAGDFDGDGCDTVSLYRPDEGRFYVINRLGSGNTGLGAAERSFLFGDPGEVVLAGDFDGDGIDTVALRRGSQVLIRNALAAGPADAVVEFGEASDRVVAGDWDGGGLSTLAAFRPREGRFFQILANENRPPDSTFWFGEAGWRPVAGHFG